MPELGTLADIVLLQHINELRESRSHPYTTLIFHALIPLLQCLGVGNIPNAKNYVPGRHKYYGRFNQGVVTLNLPDVALSSGGDKDTSLRRFITAMAKGLASGSVWLLPVMYFTHS